MTEDPPAGACAARGIRLWLPAFLILFGTGMLVLQVWSRGHGYRGAVLFASLGLASLVSAYWNGRLHRAWVGLFFLAISAALALRTAGVLEVRISVLWPLALIGLGVILLLERFARR